jgi:histidine triad (HIT) family protein
VSAPGCLFCEIVAGTRPAHVVLDTADARAFLDVRPVFPGHCLVVPRAHVETLADLTEEAVAPLFGAVRRVASAVEQGLEAHGTFVAVNNRVSQSVPHLHVHVVPRRFKDGLRGFFWPRVKYESDAAMAEAASRIRARL